MKYIDLHIHTEYTEGNSIIEIPKLVKRAKEYGMDKIAIVDSASIKGFREFKSECEKVNIKPIYGCGFYFNYTGDKFAHLVLLAKSKKGVETLKILDKISKGNIVAGKPVISFKHLEEYSEDLIALTGGLGGVLDKLYIAGDRVGAFENINKLKRIFMDNLYLELQDNGLKENRVMRDVILNLSVKESLKVVISGGSFYLDSSDSQKCNKLRLDNGNRELEGCGYNFKSQRDIESLYPKSIIEIDNSFEIGNLCNY